MAIEPRADMFFCGELSCKWRISNCYYRCVIVFVTSAVHCGAKDLLLKCRFTLQIAAYVSSSDGGTGRRRSPGFSAIWCNVLQWPLTLGNLDLCVFYRSSTLLDACYCLTYCFPLYHRHIVFSLSFEHRQAPHNTST